MTYCMPLKFFTVLYCMRFGKNNNIPKLVSITLHHIVFAIISNVCHIMVVCIKLNHMVENMKVYQDIYIYICKSIPFPVLYRAAAS